MEAALRHALKQAETLARTASKHPHFPLFAALAVLVVTILALFRAAKAPAKRGRKAAPKRASNGGTVLVDGVRRSTRAPKASPKKKQVDVEEDEPSPPRAKKATPKAVAEATTVSPKRGRGRPPKTPATAPKAAASGSPTKRATRARRA